MCPFAAAFFDLDQLGGNMITKGEAACVAVIDEGDQDIGGLLGEGVVADGFSLPPFFFQVGKFPRLAVEFEGEEFPGPVCKARLLVGIEAFLHRLERCDQREESLELFRQLLGHENSSPILRSGVGLPLSHRAPRSIDSPPPGWGQAPPAISQDYEAE